MYHCSMLYWKNNKKAKENLNRCTSDSHNIQHQFVILKLSWNWEQEETLKAYSTTNPNGFGLGLILTNH